MLHIACTSTVSAGKSHRPIGKRRQRSIAPKHRVSQPPIANRDPVSVREPGAAHAASLVVRPSPPTSIWYGSMPHHRQASPPHRHLALLLARPFVLLRRSTPAWTTTLVIGNAVFADPPSSPPTHLPHPHPPPQPKGPPPRLHDHAAVCNAKRRYAHCPFCLQTPPFSAVIGGHAASGRALVRLSEVMQPNRRRRCRPAQHSTTTASVAQHMGPSVGQATGVVTNQP